MLIPFNTDAPLYHFPYATIGLIVVNTLVYLATAQAEPEQIEPYILMFGDGWHPVQWVTTNFLHADFMHLLGNMFYLWGFGLVVEGKLGWWRFLGLYLLIGVLCGAIVQTLMLHSFGGALGASGVIYGLLAISLVWAPRNELDCLLFFGMTPSHVELSIIFFSTLYLLWEFALAWLGGFAMSSAVLHLTGAGIGAVFGVAMVKLEWVDCEGWDLFAVLAGSEGSQSRERVRNERPRAAEDSSPAAASLKGKQLVAEMERALLNDDNIAALQSYDRLRHLAPDEPIREASLFNLIKSLHDSQQWRNSLAPMADFLHRFPDRSTRMRLKLAQILIARENRPQKALQVLSKLPSEPLDKDLEPARQKLLAHAKRLAEDGDLEIADEAW